MTAQHASPPDLLTRELWLARRLRQHGAAVFEGVTDREIRRERVRAAILAHGLAQVIVGHDRDRRPVTYAEVFSRVYGEPLEPSHRQESLSRQENNP